MNTVLHIIWGLEVGGKEHFLTKLSIGLDSDRFSNVIWTLRKKGPYYTSLKDKGFSLRCFKKKPGLDFKTIRQLKREIALLDPDLIHMHDFTSAFSGMSALPRSKSIPTVITLHGALSGLNTIKRMIYRILLRRASMVTDVAIPQAELLKRKLNGVTPVRRIPYGIDTKPFYKNIDQSHLRQELHLPPTVPIVVTVARLESAKDHTMLLEAADLVCKQIPDCLFLIVGEGSREKYLTALSTEKQLDNNVFFLGKRMNIPDILSLANVCVLPSFREGLPIAILEYMAASKPVIATDVGGVAELVHNNENGYLLKAGDVETLSDKLLFLLNNPATAEIMGSKGRKLVEKNFSFSVMFNAYADLYESVINNKTHQLVK